MKKILSIIALSFVFCLFSTTYTYSATKDSTAKLERKLKREERKLEKEQKDVSNMVETNKKLRDKIDRLRQLKQDVLD